MSQILSFAMEIVEVANRDDKRALRVAYNSIFRKLFGYKYSESVSALQHFLGRPTWEELVERRKVRFFSRVSSGCRDSLAYGLLQVS